MLKNLNLELEVWNIWIYCYNNQLVGEIVVQEVITATVVVIIEEVSFDFTKFFHMYLCFLKINFSRIYFSGSNSTTPLPPTSTSVPPPLPPSRTPSVPPQPPPRYVYFCFVLKISWNCNLILISRNFPLLRCVSRQNKYFGFTKFILNFFFQVWQNEYANYATFWCGISSTKWKVYPKSTCA